MRTSRLLLATAVVFAACTDENPVPPASDFGPPPVASQVAQGGENGSDPDFYWLPPLVKNSNPIGTFNPYLAPSIEVCQLVSEEIGCGDPATVVASFGPGEVSAGDAAYQLNWDTNDPDQNDIPLLETEDYRVRVLIGDYELGHLDVDPQDPDGTSPSDVREGFHTFRLGETLPLKFWVSEGALCETLGFDVIDCVEGTIFDATGGTLLLDDIPDPLALTIPVDGLNYPVLTFIIEWLDESVVECLPNVDAPQYGPCMRVRTIPETDNILEYPAVVSVCIDLTAFNDLDLAYPEQFQHMQLYKWNPDEDTYYALANVATNACPAPAPLDGGTALARLFEPVKRLFGATPVRAGHFGAGGMVDPIMDFSHVKWVLPGEIGIVAGDDQVGNVGVAFGTDPVVRVMDDGDPNLPETDPLGRKPVKGATVHFQYVTGTGTVETVDAVTDAAGYASGGDWIPGSQGAHALDVDGFGLFSADSETVLRDCSASTGTATGIAAHENCFELSTGTVQFNATAAGAPAVIIPGDPDLGSVVVGTELESPLVVTVNDGIEVGFLGVPNVDVVWTVSNDNGTFATEPGTGGGVTTITTTTGDDGTTSVYFTMGTQADGTTTTITATVGSLSATFTIVGLPGEPAELVLVSGNDQTAYVGQTLADDLVIRVEDLWNNVITDQAVDWTVLTGGGSITPLTNTSASWTMGGMPGPATAQASLGTLDPVVFNATAECFDGWGTATIDGEMGDEWTCANAYPFTANLGNGGVPATMYWMNDADNLYFAVVVEGADKVNSLRFDFLADVVNDVLVEGDDGFNYDPATDTYTDEYLTLKCTNSSQSGCGDLDVNDSGTAEGDGAFTNVGGVTIYEASKPLDSADDDHDFSLGTGDSVKTFWTLRLGNGAKGNTQVPGFREWLEIFIVGW